MKSNSTILLRELTMSYIKPVFRCSDAEKAKFNTSQCLLTISVGQEVHEAEKFEATIELVNKHFKSCIMMIDDTLQRHTMALNTPYDADFFYEHSVTEGYLWLQRNKKYYSKLTILNQIIHWNTWLAHPEYKNKKDQIESLIQHDSSFHDCFESTITEFLNRYYRRLVESEHFDRQKAHQLCYDYLVEECTAMCLWPELNCQFEVYPSQRNDAMTETHKRLVVQNYPDLLHAVAIKFKNRKQLKPQRFNLIMQNEAELQEELLIG